MRIFYSRYVLNRTISQDSRRGALLKIVFADGYTGYADCHPWVELGDKPLEQQLRILKQGQVTALTSQSLKFARIDAVAREKEYNLFSDLVVPSSHWHLGSLSEEVPKGFSYCKLKVGKDPETELKDLRAFFSNLPESLSVRLDFNNRITLNTFERYIYALQPFLEKIDFIEDPFPYDREAWEQIQKKHGIRLAADFNTQEFRENIRSHAVSVIKPAVEDYEDSPHDVVFTSYLDHPVGQVAAAYVAATCAKIFPEKILHCGLLTHYVYQTNPYSEMLEVEGDCLLPPKSGKGFGFDELLQREKWVELT